MESVLVELSLSESLLSQLCKSAILSGILLGQ